MRIINQPPIAKTQQSHVTAPKREASRSSFQLPEEPGETKAKPPMSRAKAAAHAAGLETLLAVQSSGGQDDRKERRRKGLKRGRDSLDLLDTLKMGLLSGEGSPAALLKLKSLSGEPRLPTDDAGLDDVLDAIDLRAQVELAKFEARSSG